jgi:hypothetical protein
MKYIIWNDEPLPKNIKAHVRTNCPGHVKNTVLLTNDYNGAKCLTGKGLENFDYEIFDKNFDYEIFDNYLKFHEDCFFASEELFKFLKDRYGFDHIIKRIKTKGQS